MAAIFPDAPPTPSLALPATVLAPCNGVGDGDDWAPSLYSLDRRFSRAGAKARVPATSVSKRVANPSAAGFVRLGMSHAKSKTRRRTAARPDLTVAKPLAPEDVQPTDFLAVLHVTYEFPSFFWCFDANPAPREEPVRMRFLPDDGGMPLKVKSVCLPFVLVEAPDGSHRNLDLRELRVARLDKQHATAAWKAHKQAARLEQRRSSRRK